MDNFFIFKTEQLIPNAWLASAKQVRVFNPSIIKTEQGWIMAYRFVADDQVRRIALCRLSDDLEIIPDTAFAFSDYVRGASRNWFADPRLYKVGKKLILYWNTGWHEPRNYQYMQELDINTLQPNSILISLNVKENQNALEKNWMFFGQDLEFAVYSVNPHRILKRNLELGFEAPLEDAFNQVWDNARYESVYGKLRGGCPPQLVGDKYYSVCHSVYGVAGDYRYQAVCYTFSASAPFRPMGRPRGGLILPVENGPTRIYEKLNPAVGEVIYPCGAVFDNGRWYISYGINDESCAIAVIQHQAIDTVIESID
jgi:predicted GH43/DUF377 family glycosyl hydrolase